MMTFLTRKSAAAPGSPSVMSATCFITRSRRWPRSWPKRGWDHERAKFSPHHRRLRMNSEKPLTPREELEVRLTALLLGELPADEAVALEERMASDPELAALHGRLRQAIELLREATAIPEVNPQPTPARLSSERRAKLLEHFSNEEGGTRNAERK